MIALVPGQTIRVPTQHYAFGEGELHMRVTEHLGEYTLGGERWAELKGYNIRPDGTLAKQERYASVRIKHVRVVAEPDARRGASAGGGSSVTK
ncbi:hypothetical protein [Micromonospora sp. NPDC047730]|uniref:hypothetical protein n=1 Tax=Micromonospora sp. NPDC047730 TaxID=3364253 RepID=UPI003722D73D